MRGQRLAGLLLGLTLGIGPACSHRGSQPQKAHAYTAPHGGASAAKVNAPGASAERETLRAALDPALRAATDCYEAALKDDTSLHPKLLWHLQVNAAGALEGSALAREAGQASMPALPKAFQDCLKAAFAKLHFPPSGEPYELQIPLAFVPKKHPSRDPIGPSREGGNLQQ